jgi:hypothetical protein
MHVCRLEELLMEIISSRGELKMLSSEVSAIQPAAGINQVILEGDLYSFFVSRTAGQVTYVTYSGGNSNCNAARLGVSATRLYAPSEGWYLCTMSLTTTTMTAHTAVLQIHSSRLGAFFAYKTFNLPAASFGFPTIISLSGLVYLYPEDSIFSYWGASQAIDADEIHLHMYKL